MTEFFQTALSSILYQRGVYPPESFEPKKKYGLTVMAVKDSKLESYLDSVLTQFKGAWGPGVNAGPGAVSPHPSAPPGQAMTSLFELPCADWLALGTLQQVVLVIASRLTKQVQERWAFDIQTDKDVISTQ